MEEQQQRGGPGGIAARTWIALAAVAAAYVASAKLGIELSVGDGVITPVWAPSGIALAALVLFGPRLWPAVALGAFVANVTSGASPELAAAIAVGNTLEALVGATLLRRVGFRPGLERGRDVLALVALGAFAATTIGATNGVTALAVAGDPAASPYGSAWVLWWLGDAMGNLLVAPLLFVWAAHGVRRLDGRRVAEGLALAVLLAGASAAVFLGGLWRYPYVLFPLLVWATLRFRQLGAVTGSFLVAAFAIAGIVSGLADFARGDPTTEVQIVQGLLAFVAVSLLFVGATLAERDAAARALVEANERLAEAQELAHVGSWEWDVRADRVTWSSELFRIFGVDPATELTYERYLEHVHPADRAQVRAVIGEAFERGPEFAFTHRIARVDGTERTVQSRGRVVRDAAGAPLRMAGTAQDVTERHLLEQVRENILIAVSHELRTPLTAILGFALTLRDRGSEMTPALRVQMVEHVVEQAERLQRLLADLLDADRLRRGTVAASFEELDVGELVERTARSRPTGDHPLELDVRPVVARVDAAKVERIVENLVGNAVKHTPPGTPIAVRVARNGSGVLIAVEDEGPGIPDDARESVFRLFVRGTGGHAEAPGTGIGLALVEQFTRLHGGEAWVEPREAGGSSFRVLLPLRPPGAETGP